MKHIITLILIVFVIGITGCIEGKISKVKDELKNELKEEIDKVRGDISSFGDSIDEKTIGSEEELYSLMDRLERFLNDYELAKEDYESFRESEELEYLIKMVEEIKEYFDQDLIDDINDLIDEIKKLSEGYSIEDLKAMIEDIKNHINDHVTITSSGNEDDSSDNGTADDGETLPETQTLSVQIDSPLISNGTIEVSNGESLRLFASVSGDIDGVTYHWDFDDGETSSLQNPVKIYTTRSSLEKFTITLTATDGAGTIVVDTVTVTVIN